MGNGAGGNLLRMHQELYMDRKTQNIQGQKVESDRTSQTGFLSSVHTVMRNKDRVLNHLPLAKRKVDIMKSLGFHENCSNRQESGRLLKALKTEKIEISDAIEVIHVSTGMSVDAIRKDLLFCYRTGLLEFHITDVCDLQCIDCHYRQKDNATIPFSSVSDYLKHLNPNAITVTGGGEPNCYHSEGKDLNDLVLLIHDEFPHIQMGLINNNTYLPDGKWYDFLSWQRTSLDAHDVLTYEKIKRKRKYNACIENIYHLLDSPIPHVGIGFLYRSENIAGMETFLLDWFERWQKMNIAQKEKFNIQFRPISPAIDRVFEYDPQNGLERQTAAMVLQIKKHARSHEIFNGFLKNQTNFYSIGTNSSSFFLHERKPFVKCYNALLHRVLRSDGNEYPDFLLCNDPSMSLGNVLAAKNADDERIRIALGTFYFYHRLAEQYCHDESCRQCWVSNLIEQHWDSDVNNLNIPDNYFF
ncbi:MAG: hypothetical protein LBK58_02250 [Prevotellaceae bacterium]|nr:hypothetical protein [Prevotellaceae bacterium]